MIVGVYVWSHITPSSESPLLWPQPRSDHTVCSMVCDNQEIKVLLMRGFSDGKVLSDCWLLDVKRGIGEKVRKMREIEIQSELMLSH